MLSRQGARLSSSCFLTCWSKSDDLKLNQIIDFLEFDAKTLFVSRILLKDGITGTP